MSSCNSFKRANLIAPTIGELEDVSPEARLVDTEHMKQWFQLMKKAVRLAEGSLFFVCGW